MTVHHPLDKNSGASGSLWQLAQEYRALGHVVEIFSFDDLPSRWPEQLQMLFFPIAVALWLQKRVRRARIDVIDAHTGDSWIWSLVGRTSRRARKVALITRSSGLEHAAHLERLEEFRGGKLRLSRIYFLYHGGFRLREVARSLRASNGCIFLNNWDRNYAVQTLGVDAAKATVSGNGIPTHFTDLPLENLETQPPRIAIVGTFSDRKGIAYSVPALQKLLENHASLEIGFFGVGVIETFSHPDLPALLAPYKFQLLASLSEGFGKVLLEGMARGLACVTSDAPGPLSIAQHEINALVVPRRNTQAIVEAFERLLADEALCQKIRQNARNDAQNHTWSAIARARLEFYWQIRASKS